ncbi:MAG: hypothetical protein IT376_06675 [Polyangiaceae bacterium]|nr:hypothetical protein [Polyangiaceae bacterium]
MSASRSSLFRRVFRSGVAAAALVVPALAAGTACLDRPVEGSTPRTSNVFVDQIRQTAVERIDLLFMIDNSISMADKQALLAKAVPVLASRLVNPICVDQDGNDLGNTPTDPAAPCPSGTREFRPLNDIHIGIVSSSLGGHGGDLCDDEADEDDKGQLIGTLRPGWMPPLSSHQNQGFLFWGPGIGGTDNSTTLISDFAAHVTATGETGCGYEASLEAWYRFLIDPAPPQDVAKNAQGRTEPVLDANGAVVLNQTLLAQRAAFLRPDSLVAVIMLTDENDCSIVDYGFSWLVTTSPSTLLMPRGTAACAQDPNSPCCRSCAVGETAPPAGCVAIADDGECRKGSYTTPEDTANLRCYEQKRRFGLDFLHPTNRYVAALKDLQLCPNSPYGDADCNCRGEKRRRELLGIPFDQGGDCSARVGGPIPNPLFTDLTGQGITTPRDPGLVFLAGIVGVPWQDIATEASLTGSGLTYMTAAELQAAGRWDTILGEPTLGVPPQDPFMNETVAQRLAGGAPVAHPFLPGVTTTPPGTTNPINGNEYDIPLNDDLQYACVYDLAASRDCESETGGCDCKAGKPSTPTKPLCQGGTTVQTKAKGYPGLRILNVLRDFGENAIVASICPKNATGAETDPSYGYTPAVSAIINRLKEALNVKCLPRKLETDPVTGNVSCKIVEATFPAAGGGCTCAIEGRVDADSKVAAAVRKQLKATGQCGTAAASCDDLCLCELPPPGEAARAACETDPNPVQSEVAWCYIEEGPLVDQCPATERRLLRFVGTAATPTPRTGAIMSIACLGAAFSTTGSGAPDGG